MVLPCRHLCVCTYYMALLLDVGCEGGVARGRYTLGHNDGSLRYLRLVSDVSSAMTAGSVDRIASASYGNCVSCNCGYAAFTVETPAKQGREARILVSLGRHLPRSGRTAAPLADLPCYGGPDHVGGSALEYLLTPYVGRQNCQIPRPAGLVGEGRPVRPI